MPSDAIMKVYLGDAVYADFDGYHVVLTTENGIETTNTIYLAPDVVAALDQFVKAIRASATSKEPIQSHSEGTASSVDCSKHEELKP